MFFTKFFAAGALISTATAIPFRPVHHEKRDIAWVTQVQEDIVTVAVTTTVWLNPGETPEARVGAPHGHHGHHRHKHHKSQRTHYVHNTVTVHPVPATAAYTSPAETNTEAAATTPTTTSIYTAPTTTPYVAPTTTPYVAPATPATTQTAPTPTPDVGTSSTSGSGSSVAGLTEGIAAAGTTYTGDLTWYQTGLGACGITSSPSDHIVAISEDIFDAYATANPNDNPLCGKSVTITGVNGSPYQATIVDRCTGCAEGDLDLSEDFFNTVTDNGNGRVSGITWKFD